MIEEREATRGSIKSNFVSYKQKWYVTGVGESLRKRYHHDREAYFAAYRPSYEECLRLQEEGMKYFSRLVNSLEVGFGRDLSQQAYYDRGQSVLESWCMALATDQVDVSEDNDVVFVALDFEGDPHEHGITEVGFTKLDARELFSHKRLINSDVAQGYRIKENATRHHITTTSSAHSLLNSHFSFARGHSRAWLFGETVRKDASHMQQVIVDNLTIPDTTKNGEQMRRIVLVGHAIRNELRNMRYMNLDLEALPMVVGLVDTARLSKDYLQSGWPSLERLTKTLGIPLHHNLGGVADKLHNAGNDAHYTMRAMLALSSLKYSAVSRAQSGDLTDTLAQMMKLAMFPVPVLSTHAQKRKASPHDLHDNDADSVELFWTP